MCIRDRNNIEIKDDLTFSEYLPQKSDFYQRVKYDFPPLAIALKDYNAVRKMLGYEPIILKTDEFATHWHSAAAVSYTHLDVYKRQRFASRAALTSAPKVSKPGQSSTFAI